MQKVKYFKRHRMELAIGHPLPLAELPVGFRWLAWDDSLLALHAEVKFLSFHQHEDALVFPNALLEPLSPRALTKRWEAAARDMGVQVTFHALRHTHASHLAMKGVGLGVIAAQLGHADTRMTERHYSHLAPSYVANTIRAHFPTLGIAGESNVALIRRTI